MKVEPRVALFGLVMGSGLTITLVILALASPDEGFLILLFPSVFLWILIPFLLLRLVSRASRGEER